MREALKVDMKEILAWIGDEGITPSALSPFYAEEPAGNRGAKLEAGAMPLVRVVCDPAASVSARILSAEGVVVTRIYANETGQLLVRHWLDKDGLHNFRPVQETDIATEAALRLMLDIEPSRLDFNAELSEAAFCALLGLIDCWRERTLLSLIDRRPNINGSFTTEEVYAAFRRSIGSSDLRWLTPLVQELYPGNLDVSPSLFNQGILGLAEKFAGAANGVVKLNLLGEELCSSLSAPLAAVKLSVHWIKEGTIREENMLGVRGMGIFCVMEIDEQDPAKVTLQNSSAPMIELYVHSRLTKALRVSKDAEAKKTAAETVSPRTVPSGKTIRFCSQCGQPVKPEHRFCKGCGKAIA
ncbi:MAG: hypothetical protein EG826_03675 [Deltaproteobacteria bacterium]|nr:hypothetical protein [Deltaproteobacteria bacterium]